MPTIYNLPNQEKEFNLSEKIFWIETAKRRGGSREARIKRSFEASGSYLNEPRLKVKDVKEFIKRLKEGLPKIPKVDGQATRFTFWDCGKIEVLIDKLAGEELI